ncbi:gluconokinase [Chitinispirillales bacterium ANBcel5]|uniref:gluconokinase n=1 Tax=Cellulosispirillum alkaliphilum TaxID=3039283 RepID=UPI002A574C9F|nr:gluconokinase [Chitinispirillales bacterium ANBcel5]
MVYIIMGVTASGKTTVGKLLSSRLGCNFYDGDSLHPPNNIKKMRTGIALNDKDRQPWLERIAHLVSENVKLKKDAVIACSALKKRYRDIIRGQNLCLVLFVYLYGSYELILKRSTLRTEHFMPSSLVESQFKDLEEPEDALTVSSETKPEEIVEKIIDYSSNNCDIKRAKE